MTKWEYLTQTRWDKEWVRPDGVTEYGDTLNKMLAELGKLGWELVQIFESSSGSTAIFKRPSDST